MRLIMELIVATALTLAATYSIGLGNAHEATIINAITNNGPENYRLIMATADINETGKLHDTNKENHFWTMVAIAAVIFAVLIGTKYTKP